MDFAELISSIEVELEATQKRRQKAKAEIKLILDSASQEGRASLSEVENDRTKELFGIIDLAKVQEQGIRSKLENARKAQAEDEDFDVKSRQTRTHAPNPASRSGSREEHFHVTGEERTYNPDNDPAGRMFLTDVARQAVANDVQAASRLARHMQEERVERTGSRQGQLSQRAAGDLTSTGGTGLVVPQYLIDLTAPHTANMRPFADACNGHPLPAEGLTLNVPRVTTASSVAKQSAELADASATSIVTDDLSVSVLTASGRQNVSRQAIDRGSGIEDIVLQDLFAQYATNLDSMLFSTATHGLQAVAVGGSSTVTYTDASATAAEMYPFFAAGASKVNTALIGRGSPDLVVMPATRWYWMTSELTTEWPFITSAGFQVQQGGVNNDAPYASGLAGRLPNGLGVVADANVPQDLDDSGASGTGTNDAIYVVSSRECHLWEEPGQPAYIRAEQPLAANLGIQLVVYGYFGFTFERYANAVALLIGTGLAAVTGF